MAKKTNRRKRKKNSLFKNLLKVSIFLTLIAVVGTLAYMVYLDHQVREKFEGKRFELPARVFARPLELFVGKSLTLANLEFELKQLGYRASGAELKPGEYTLRGHRAAIFIRAFEFWDVEQPQRLINVTLERGVITALVDGSSTSGDTAQTMEIIRLEPAEIGGIYPSKNEDRRLVRFEDIPRHFIDALVATEDQRFYLHHGVDPRALLRAAVSTITGRELQGGSTITQQLVKNFYLTPERSLKRKFNEMLMALLLEMHYEKNDILETYVNEVYFGQDGPRAIHGVGLASHFYFGKAVAQLEPQESALLVALLKGPVLYNPRRHPERALERRNLVLGITHAQGFLPEWSFNGARAAPLGVIAQSSQGLSRYPAFIDLVLRQLRRDYDDDDLRTEGLRIFTTLDPIVQNTIERTVADKLPDLEARYGLNANTLQAAMVVSSRDTGEIEAVLGDRAARFEGFNRALDARRQIGSLFKPIVFLEAFSRPGQYNLMTELEDSPLVVEQPGAPVWEPNNYDREFRGQVPAWRALAGSLNVPTARLGIEVGLPEIMILARKLGVETDLPHYPATLLGATELSVLEVTQVYQTLAAGGFRVPLRAIREVLTRDGEPLQRYGIEVERVVDERAVFLVNSALQWAVEMGTGTALKRYLPSEFQIAGKTGTTDDLRDSWFAAFSGDKVAVTWVGNDRNQPVKLTGATGALVIWGTAMAQLDPQPLDLRMPEGVSALTVNLEDSARSEVSCRHGVEMPFFAGYVPEQIRHCQQPESMKSKLRGWWRRLTD